MAKNKYKNKKNIANDKPSQDVVETVQDHDAEDEVVVQNVRGDKLTIDQKNTLSLSGKGRIPVIDNARGVIVLGIIVLGYMFRAGHLFERGSFANFFFMAHSLPRHLWIDGVQRFLVTGITMIDMATPIILLTTAMALGVSFRRRAERDGVKAAKRHIISRGLGLIAISVIFNELLFMATFHLQVAVAATWDIIASVGAGLVVGALLIDKSYKKKIIIMLAMLLASYLLVAIPTAIWPFSDADMSILTHPLRDLFGAGVGWNPVLYLYSENVLWGGIFSFLTFGPLLVFYDIIIELAFKNFKRFLVVFGFVVGLAIISLVVTYLFYSPMHIVDTSFLLNPLVINFRTASLGYLLVGGMLGCIAALIMALFNNKFDRDIPVVSSLGRNSMLFFFLFIVTIEFVYANIMQSIFTAGGTDEWAPIQWYFALLGTIIMTAITLAVAIFLDKRKWYLKV